MFKNQGVKNSTLVTRIPLSGTPSPCPETHPCLERQPHVMNPIPMSGTPSPCLEPHPMSGTPLLVWNPIPMSGTPSPCQEPHPMFGTPPLVWNPIPMSGTPSPSLEPTPCQKPHPHVWNPIQMSGTPPKVPSTWKGNLGNLSVNNKFFTHDLCNFLLIVCIYFSSFMHNGKLPVLEYQHPYLCAIGWISLIYLI